MTTAYELRPYQKGVVDLCLDNQGRDVCVCAPVASGKTHISYDTAIKAKGKVAIITYANELIRQYREDFPLPFLIGKAHYQSKKAYEEAFDEVTRAKVALFNPITYLNYIQKVGSEPFDCVIWDEADACLGLLQLWDGETYEFKSRYATPEAIGEAMSSYGKSLEQIQYVLDNLHQFWWEVKEVKKKGQDVRVLHLHPLVLSPLARKIIKAPTNILLSGTLMPTICQEMLGHNQYIYQEIPSTIPIENRKVICHADEEFNNTIEGQLDLLTDILSKFEERPAIVHTTYSEAAKLKELLPYNEVLTYVDPADKVNTIVAAEAKEFAVLAGGATTGLNLKYEKCRLNVILRGAFANLGNDFVRRRKSLPGGDQWYEQVVLRHFVQACGRSTRSPDDYSRIVVGDGRLVSLAYRSQHLLPRYFAESLFRSS